MIIQSSNMQTASARNYTSRTYSYTGVQVLNDGGQKNGQTFSDIVGDFQNTQSVRSASLSERLQSVHQIRSQAINYLLQLLFGGKSEKTHLSSALSGSTEAGTLSGENYIMQTMRHTSYFHTEENETTSFSAQGSVVTADGRQLDFNLQLTLSRSFVEETQSFVDYTQPVLCDPLVIQLDGSVPSISDQKFTFDLDADGASEEISLLGEGNAFLALDKNDDGIINDGSELFGVQSGNGFADLAAYDIDKNGWIDEADEIFDRLKVWCKDEKGNDNLLTLKEAGVGAIYLDSRSTPFSFRNEENATNAVARRTGMFLYENGNCGTIQQLDMAT